MAIEKKTCWTSFSIERSCHDLSIGLVTKKKAWKGVGWNCNLGVTFILLGVWKSVRNEPTHSQVDSHTPQWTFTLGVGVLMESLRSPEFLENHLKGQNSLDWKFPYTIENRLRCRCLYWACIFHLNTYNTSYGQKKGWELKSQFDPWSLKVRNHLELRVCRWHATYHWKALNEGYNFVVDFISIGGLQKSYGRPKWWEFQFWKFKDWNLGENDIWVQPLWLVIENIIREKVVASPKFRLWWVLWVRVCSWFICAPKVFHLCSNQLVV
jgi:hypothetical protein